MAVESLRCGLGVTRPLEYFVAMVNVCNPRCDKQEWLGDRVLLPPLVNCYMARAEDVFNVVQVDAMSVHIRQAEQKGHVCRHHREGDLAEGSFTLTSPIVGFDAASHRVAARELSARDSVRTLNLKARQSKVWAPSSFRE